MARYLLDTNHVGTLIRDDASPVWERLDQLSRKQYALCWPSIAELWFMVLNSARVEENRSRLNSVLQQFPIWRFEADEAIEFGRLRVELGRQGRPIPAIDLMIAAIARANKFVVVTADRHFTGIKGLGTENWLE